MKKILYIGSLLFLFSQWCIAQEGMYHIGGLRLGNNAQVGIHTNWINDSPLEAGFGTVGFYGDQAIAISGAFPPTLFGVELFNAAGVDLNIGLIVQNSLSFIDGNLRTDRTDQSTSAFFEGPAFVLGSTDQTKVDGQVSFSGKSLFNAPTGSAARLRSVEFNFGSAPSSGSCTYFFENPSFPTSLAEGFNTASMAPSLDAVSPLEFWLIGSPSTATLTLSWDRNSLLSTLTDNPDAITLVGWNPALRQWVPVPVQSRVGGLDEGFLTTETLAPDQYAAYTFGILNQPDELLTLDNYFLSPNGDGVNDRLVIEELQQSPNNRIVIFNRAGLKVFEFDNYTDQFNGNANAGSSFYGTDLGLPEGVYYYIARLDDLQLNFQGFLFLDR